MSIIFPPFLILLSFLLSTSVLPRFSFGANFDVGLILIICYGLSKGQIRGAFFGFFTGLVYGMLLANMVGLFVLLGFTAGFVGGIFHEYDDDRSLVITILIVLGIVFAYQTASFFGQAVFFGQLGVLQRFFAIVLPKTILTTALFVPVYLLMGFVRTKCKAS